MAKVSARTARWAKWAVVPAALLVSGVAVSQASYSAFSATTESSASNWKTGSVALDNTANPTSSATFNAENLKPGSTGSRCITVTSSGSLPSAVKLYTSAHNTTKALSSNINLTITQGTGAVADCTDFRPLPANSATVYEGTLAALAAKATGFSTGLGTWTTTGGEPKESRTYRIAYTMNPQADNTTMGGTASVAFAWEAQNS